MLKVLVFVNSSEQPLREIDPPDLDPLELNTDQSAWRFWHYSGPVGKCPPQQVWSSGTSLFFLGVYDVSNADHRREMMKAYAVFNLDRFNSRVNSLVSDTIQENMLAL